MIETQFFILIITTFLVSSRQKHLSSLRDDQLGNPALYDYVQAQEEVPLPAYLEEMQHLADIPDSEPMQYLNPNDDDSSEPDFIEVGKFPPRKVVLPYVVQLPSRAIHERIPFNRLKRIQPLFVKRHLKNLSNSQEIQTKPEQDEASEEIQRTPLILTDSQLSGQTQTKPEQEQSSEEIQGLPLILTDGKFPGQTPKPEQDKNSEEIQRIPLILTGSQLPGQIHWEPQHNEDFEDIQRKPLIFTASQLPGQLQSKPVQDTAPEERKRKRFMVKLFGGVMMSPPLQKSLSRKSAKAVANEQPRFIFFH